MQEVLKYFPNLTAVQIKQFDQLLPLYEEWNAMINVISRKDISNIYIHHVLHSLAIAKFISFKPGTKILDLGTGGGFPAIPLAILFPEIEVTAIDGRGKKILVLNEIAKAIGLTNVKGIHIRSEELNGRYDFVVSRAVASIEKLAPLCRKFYSNHMMHGIPNGLIALKGGNIENEIKELERGEYVETVPISDYFDHPFYEEKYVVYLQG